ncbi:hypothetical protein [Sphingomonas turrisvirgatae]|uniref:Uncharacterized protein n=1 Tax=Sphingomonas turrisvirgatae TaxID=1888892 RepID=A0A1E3LSK1_9SPHN|nr:hypothetical protein [Sphingomonas turrisvirgatae]ODP36737.1 hypothetical protein BFL28_19745 [Sphingomonas turrisvirgatae]
MLPNADLQSIVTAVLARAPDWLKRELIAKEEKTRREAEESLATMIAAALVSANDNRTGTQ